MVFVADTLMPYEVPSAVTRTILQLREKEDEIGKEGEFLDSYVARYHITEDGVAKGQFVKAGHKKKKKQNREYVTVKFQMNGFDRDQCLEKVRNIKKKVIPVVIATLKDHSRRMMMRSFPKCSGSTQPFGPQIKNLELKTP